jgi:hypothetical protein
MKIQIVSSLKRGIFLVYGMMVFLGGWGCASQELLQRPIPTFEGVPLPEKATASSPTPTRTPAPQAFAPQNPPPVTPTPVLYAIVANDTFSAIANRHNISLATLIAANPEVDPNFLTIGTTLTIPVDQSQSQSTNLPTPIPVLIHKTDCFTTADQALWCLVSVENDQSFDLENLSAQVFITNPPGNIIANQAATNPHNIIRSGQKMALGVYFLAPMPADFQVHVEILTGLPVASDDQRYIFPTITITLVEIAANGLQANFTAEIALAENDPTSSKTSILAIAYDDANLPCGFRKIDLAQPLTANNIKTIEATVFSLGPPISRIDFFAEGRP